MKTCRFCNKDIADGAIKCISCGNWTDATEPALTGQSQTASIYDSPVGQRQIHDFTQPAQGLTAAEKKEKWTQSTTAVVIGLCTLGPFALPLLWSNKRFSTFTKTWVTVVTIVGFSALLWLTWYAVSQAVTQIKTLY